MRPAFLMRHANHRHVAGDLLRTSSVCLMSLARLLWMPEISINRTSQSAICEASEVAVVETLVIPCSRI